jgi:hypothetical protein
MNSPLRVRARGDARLPVPGYAGRYVGRAADGSVIPEGVDVPDDSYHQRAIARGDIELAPSSKENAS